MVDNTVSVMATVSILGMEAPAVSFWVSIAAVLLVRVMLLSKEPITKGAWWVYNVALTILLMLGAAIFTMDRKLGPGSALLLGIGLGSSGIVLIDLAKRYLEVIVGKTTSDTPKDTG